MNDLSGPVVVGTFQHEMEAAAAINALARIDVEARMVGVMTAGFRCEAPGDISVLVTGRDFDKAQRLLAEMKAEPVEIDWSQVDVGEPEPDLASE